MAVVLNSSQSKTPCGDDTWIKATSHAISELVNEGHTIITSLDMITWELAVYLTATNKGKQIIISPIFDDKNGLDVYNQAILEFNLDPAKTAMVFIKPDEHSRSPKSNWAKRDKAAFELANLITPISIRPRGRLEGLLNDCGISTKIESKWKIEYSRSIYQPPKYKFNNNPDAFGSWDYLVHWTKTCHGPWPNEKSSAFYKRLLESGMQYPGNGLETLLNIIKNKMIYGSSEKIRDGISVVGFSEVKPDEMTRQIRWRHNRVNYNFEPYGVAIRKTAATQLGIKPVIYGTSDDYNDLPESEKPFFQNKGEKNVDWSYEREWRHLGDLDLNKIEPKNLALLVWNKEEKTRLMNQTQLSIFNLC